MIRRRATNSRRQKGFTIVELTIIILVIAILTSISIGAYNTLQKQTRDYTRKSDTTILAEALEKYYSENGEYPSCAMLRQDPATIASSTLVGIDTSVFKAPRASVANSIVCTDLTDSDVYAYLGDGSIDCAAGTFCLGFVLKYRSEATGEIVEIKSRYNSDIAGVELKKGWSQLSTSYYNSCALATDDRFYCWGWGVLSGSSEPVYTSDALSGKTVKAVSAGSSHRCVIASDGQAYCWGSNNYGQLGNNSTVDSSALVPVDTSGVLSGKTIKSIGVGSQYTCALASDNQVYCWGNGSAGVLGTGSTSSSPVPVAVTTSGVLAGKTIKSIGVGNQHVCVIASDNQAYCWGYNGSGRLGNNSTVNTSYSAPVAVYMSGVLIGKTIKSIAVGYLHTCAIASDNQAYCWGYNNSGELGTGSTSSSPVPVAVTTSGVLAGKTVNSITAGGHYTCAIASDNQAYCWGYNNSGELGTGSTSSSPVPVAVDISGALSGKTVKSISAGHDHACAIASDNQAYCWGRNNAGQLGISSYSPTTSSVPLLVSYPSM